MSSKVHAHAASNRTWVCACICVGLYWVGCMFCVSLRRGLCRVTLQVTRVLNQVVRGAVELEMGMNSVERLLHYAVRQRCGVVSDCGVSALTLPPLFSSLLFSSLLFASPHPHHCWHLHITQLNITPARMHVHRITLRARHHSTPPQHTHHPLRGPNTAALCSTTCAFATGRSCHWC